MEHDHKKQNMTDALRDTILAKIKTDKITMRPRLYFTLQIAAVMFTALAVLLMSVFIFNFILFSIRINSHEALFSFGPRGVLAFLEFFPWPFLLLDVLSIALLEWLLRTFKFGYRLPILYVLGAIFAITFVTGFALDRGTVFNDFLMERAEGEHHLPPPFNTLYGDARRDPHDGICLCTITAIVSGTLTVEDHHHHATSTFTVVLPANDPRATTTGLSVGDTVLVAGDRDDGVIEAFGVRKVTAPPGAPGSGPRQLEIDHR